MYMQIGKYFTLEELTASSVAEKNDIDNSLDPRSDHDMEVIDNLIDLVQNVLDPAREALGEPIYISSGYRCEQLNRILLGVKNSQHLVGEAADIYCQHMDKLLPILKNLIFDQLIIYKYKGFYHVSYTTRRSNRMQLLNK